MQASWKRFGAPAIERLTGPVDIVHATNFVLPALRSTPGVVTVHDLSFYRDDVFPGGERLRELVPWSVERASGVIAPTRVIADEIAERFGLPPDKLHVTHEGVAPVFFGASPLPDTRLGRMGIPGPFAVAAGTIEPRKNLTRLLQAWRAASDELRGWTLVIAGPKGWGADLPETPGVILTGRLDDETLPGLLAAASFFCYPSVYEGFGLPPLEAMAAGTPVLAGGYGAAEEVLGDAAMIVDPLDVDALAGGLVSLASDRALRARFQVAGRARAAGFTWLGTGKATIRAYRSVLGT
jgi:glycosyltransferase involved in cell wall biosynthesis